MALAAASLNASGTNGGGTILIGGAAHGAGSVPLATNTFVNAATTITADATTTGNGGTGVVWSQDSTQFFGTISAKGGAAAGNGGWIETSSANTLTFGGFANAAAPNGVAGSLLLDPRNITIGTASGAGSYIQLIDPNSSGGFGDSSRFLVLANNNIAVGDYNANIGGMAAAGAVYLFNGTTGALISELDGSHAGDLVGFSAPTALTGNNNIVVASPNWNNGGNTANALGAVTWMNGSTGALSTGGTGGAVSSANSLVGSNPGDAVGTGVIALTNGNYVVASPNWNNGGNQVNALGAVTWGNGSTGQLSDGNVGEAVSSANSLVGSSAGDIVGGLLNESVFAARFGGGSSALCFPGCDRARQRQLRSGQPELEHRHGGRHLGQWHHRARPPTAPIPFPAPIPWSAPPRAITRGQLHLFPVILYLPWKWSNSAALTRFPTAITWWAARTGTAARALSPSAAAAL